MIEKPKSKCGGRPHLERKNESTHQCIYVAGPVDHIEEASVKFRSYLDRLVKRVRVLVGRRCTDG